MHQNIRHRVLIVEDMHDISESFKFVVERAGYIVDVVDRKATAIRALKSKLYDVALVDLQLKDDITHKGGLDVLDAINDLQDGTVAIVVSATQDIGEAVDSYRRKAAGFIMKGNLKSKDIVDAIEGALSKYRRSHFGDFPSLSAYLAEPDLVPIWESNVAATLGCGVPAFQKLIWSAFSPYLPIIRKKNGSPSFVVDKTKGAITGAFWSKELGSAIWFSAAGNGVNIGPTESDSERLGFVPGKDVSGEVWKIASDRGEFLERISDRPGRAT